MLSFLLSAWAFVRSPQGHVLGLLLGFLAMLWVVDNRAYRRGFDVSESAWQAKMDIVADQARATEARNATTGQRVESEAKAASVEIRWKTRTLIEKVPVYVPIDPPGWSLPVGFVRLHRSATSGLPVEPGPAGLPDDAGSGIALAALAELDIDNAGVCHAEIDRLTRLQEWVRETR